MSTAGSQRPLAHNAAAANSMGIRTTSAGGPDECRARRGNGAGDCCVAGADGGGAGAADGVVTAGLADGGSAVS
jgi:hypothetical protein